jgi:hypothetical protein
MADAKTWKGIHKTNGTTVQLTDKEKASYENDPVTRNKYRFEPLPPTKPLPAPTESKPAAKPETEKA